MNRIISRKNLSDDMVRFEISTSLSLKDFKPGQYMVFRVKRNSPGIALPVLKTNVEKGTVIVFASAWDEATAAIAQLGTGTIFTAIDGPYGYPCRVENVGTVLCIGRERGIIALVPVIMALKGEGNRVITVLSASSAEGIILENEIRAIAHEVIVVTDDGSYGEKKLLSGCVHQLLRTHTVNEVFVFGGAKAIRDTCSATTTYPIPTQAVMVPQKYFGQLSHGIFRVSIYGNARLICVDGFNFNAYYANFEELIRRFEHENQEEQRPVNTLEMVNRQG